MSAPYDEPVYLASHLTLAGDVPPEVRPGSQISPHDIHARIAAASGAGYRGIGFADQDLTHWVQTYGTTRIRQWIDDSGIEVVELEMLHDWYAEGSARAASDALASRLFEWAAQLGARHVKVGTGFVGVTAKEDEVVEGLTGLCERAAQAQTRIALEPMPMAMIRTPAEALALIETAGVANAGVLLDVWHVFRMGVDYDSLRAIPAERIASVELIDGFAEPVTGDLFVDSCDFRRLAGTGDFDVPRFLDAVLATGYRGPIGDENISNENRARTLTEAARANFDAISTATREALARI
jgi:sugar phosphate isomerase/epimerase